MTTPYRPTYKLVLENDDGTEAYVGNFERLDEASAYARTIDLPHNGVFKLYKYYKSDDEYRPYEKWVY